MKKPAKIVIDEALIAAIEQKKVSAANIHDVRGIISRYVCPALFVNNRIDSGKLTKRGLADIAEEREKSMAAYKALQEFKAGKPLKQVLEDENNV